MARRLTRLAATLCLLLCAAASDAATRQRWQDDAGTIWQVPADLPVRWIVLGPHLVDMVVRLGAGDRIVGVQDDHPLPGRYRTSLSGYPVVGQADRVSLESLRRAQPDLVVYWEGGLSVAQQHRLKISGLPLLALNPARLRDIPERLRWLGALAGRDRQADDLARQALMRLDHLEATAARRHRLRGFYQVWTHPLFSLSPRHLVSQALRVCGVDAIVPDTPVPAPVLSPEFVVRARPDVILVAPEQLDEARRQWQRFPDLPAVRHQAIIAVDDRALTRPGLTLLDAMPALCDQMAAWQGR